MRIASLRLFAGLFALLLAAQAMAATPPNIVFIFSDDHALRAISAYDDTLCETPGIDRIAKEGLLFRNAFCTNSICAPSRAVILTGKHSHLNGLMDNRQTFDGAQATFPKLLQGAGYQTAMIGKWHLKSEPTGFDYWKVLPGQGHYYNPDFRTPEGTVRIEGYVTEIVTEEAINWLESRDKAQPFLLMAQHKAPHRNWMPGPKELGLYRDGDLPLPDTLFDDYATRNTGARTQEMTIATHMMPSYDLKLPLSLAGNDRDDKLWTSNFDRLNPAQQATWNAAYEAENAAFAADPPEGEALVRWKYQRYIKDYLRCIQGVDRSVAAILDYLDREGLAENTLVVYSSDQGFYLGEHGWFDKRWMYEESLHMPLVMRLPGRIAPGSTDEHLVQNLDFAQTFLDLAGVDAPAAMQGQSLVPLFDAAARGFERDSIYYQYYEFPGAHSVPKHYGVRTERYKLIHYHELDEWELFDLKQDPKEMRNVYGTNNYNEVQAKLTAELQQLRREYKVE